MPAAKVENYFLCPHPSHEITCVHQRQSGGTMRQKLYPVHFRIGRAILVLLTSCIIFSTVRAQTVAVGAGSYTTVWPGGFFPPPPPPAQTAALLSQGRPVVASSA